MKQFTILLLMTACVTLHAQTPVNKTIPVQTGQTLTMSFDHPMVKVSTWDKNEISIQGTVSINQGENDDAFKLTTATHGKEVSIRGEVSGLDKLPHRITIIEGEQKMTFRDKEALRKYENEHGKRRYDTQIWGVDIDIVLEIKVPQNMSTRIDAVYGMVEVKVFDGQLVVESTYGGVDAALIERNAGEVIAETNYGNIYTNFDTKFGGEASRQENFHTYVSAKPGKGPSYSFDSKYGNVYIRKATQP
jgi:hypothetical protein